MKRFHNVTEKSPPELSIFLGNPQKIFTIYKQKKIQFFYIAAIVNAWTFSFKRSPRRAVKIGKFEWTS